MDPTPTYLAQVTITFEDKFFNEVDFETVLDRFEETPLAMTDGIEGVTVRVIVEDSDGIYLGERITLVA